MTDFILVFVIAAILTGAILYIRKEKKRGVRCVGCPSGGTCSGNCNSGNADSRCDGNKDVL